MIGILSDSHDNLVAVRKAVRIFNDVACRLVIHAGDFVAPFSAGEMGSLRCPVKAVFGNCDGEKVGLAKAFQGIGEIGEAPLIFDFEGIRYLLCHLDEPVDRYLVSEKPDVLIFGHTHRALIRKEKTTLLINPGETGGWLRGKSTIAVLDPENKTADIVSLD